MNIKYDFQFLSKVMTSNLKDEYNKFNDVAKLMNKSEISSNPSTLARYRTLIVPAYNTFLQYTRSIHSRVIADDRPKLDEKVLRAREVFVSCLNNLRCTYELPENVYQLVDESKISLVQTVPIETVTNQSEPSGSDINTDSDEDKNSDVENSDVESSDSEDKMVLSSFELFSAVNAQFKIKYSGDPLGLTSFIDGVDILLGFAETDPLRTDLLKYLKAKLDGRAREFVTNEVDTVDKLKKALQDNIAPENSKVVEGRILSLRYAHSKQEEFATKAEELADALRRTLITEGMTAVKANEISIDKTVELCRKSTTSDLVKSVLASTAFKSPKEVVAKLITESDVSYKEKQILSVKKFNKSQNGNKRGGRGGGKNQNWQNNGNNFDSNSNRQNNNYKGKSNRGRGNGRNYQNYGNNSNSNNNRYQNQGNNSNYNNNNYGSNVRVAQSGNEAGPHYFDMGAQMAYTAPQNRQL